MKNSFSFDSNVSLKFSGLVNYDQNEIDCPDLWSAERLQYCNRLQKIIHCIRSRQAPSLSVVVADIGCAQGNVSLSLAELGYKVYAIDLRADFIEYAKQKYEKGDITWVNRNIEEADLPSEYFDVIIMGELVEHCAFPEQIIRQAMRWLKINGYLIITTPNGRHFRNFLPVFSSLSVDERKTLEKKQFGPDGADHLFLLTLADINSLLPLNLVMIENGYIGSSLINQFSVMFLRLLPLLLVNWLQGVFERIPIINQYLSLGIYWVVKKTQ